MESWKKAVLLGLLLFCGLYRCSVDVEGQDLEGSLRDAAHIMSQRYGVPESLLLAMVEVETRMGTLMGNTLVVGVFEARIKKYEDGYRREMLTEDERAAYNYALAQLKQLNNIVRRTGRDISTLIGSKSGAMGPLQFIPSTWSRHGQDGDGDNIKDPYNPYDAMAAVAYFIAYHGKDSETTAIKAYNPGKKSYVNKVRAEQKEFKRGK